MSTDVPIEGMTVSENYSTLRGEGFDPPLILTPEEFSDDEQADL